MTSLDHIIFHLKRFNSGMKRFMAGNLRATFQSSCYEIKRGYIHRVHVLPHDDRGFGDKYQKEVYQVARDLMRQHQWQSVIDMGCGSGYKLMKYFGDYKTLGVDQDPSLSKARSDYPHAAWQYVQDFNESPHSADLILCADVIEHIEHPDEFLESLFSIPDWKGIVISTPERNIKRGRFHFGPPPNPGHYREWSMREFYKFISGYQNVYLHKITNVKQATQMIICLRQEQEPGKIEIRDRFISRNILPTCLCLEGVVFRFYKTYRGLLR
jgi:SAM-dependent methyltransferase